MKNIQKRKNIYVQQCYLIPLLGVVLLSGCDSFRHMFGVDHYQANEYNVVQNDDLTIPPKYELPLPTGESKKLQAETSKATQKAKDKLLKNQPQVQDTQQINNALIGHARKGKPVASNIRQELEQDFEKNQKKESLSGKLENVFDTIAKNAKNTESSKAKTDNTN